MNDFFVSNVTVEKTSDQVYGFSFNLRLEKKTVRCYMTVKREIKTKRLLPINLFHFQASDCFLCNKNSSTYVTQCKFLVNFMEELLERILKDPEGKFGYHQASLIDFEQ